jgi:hypothetical protein
MLQDGAVLQGLADAFRKLDPDGSGRVPFERAAAELREGPYDLSESEVGGLGGGVGEGEGGGVRQVWPASGQALVPRLRLDTSAPAPPSRPPPPDPHAAAAV